MRFCPKGPAFSKILTDEGLIFPSCECTTISMLLCLNSKLQVKEKDIFDCFERKQ